MTIIPQPLRSLKTAGALLLALGCAALLPAAPLLPVQLTAQGRVPAGPAGHVVVVDGLPLVLAGNKVWIKTGAEGWREKAWPHEGSLAAVFGDGRQAFALLAANPADQVQRVYQLVLVEGQLVLRPLPALPAPLLAGQGAVKESMVFVHGRDTAGVPHLFTLALSESAPAWRTYAGCPAAAGKLEALVAQQDSLYAVVTPGDGSAQRLHRWSATQAWTEISRLPGQLVPGAARAVGQAHLLLVVGELESQRIVTYYAITQMWAELGGIASTGLHPAAAWGNGFLLAQASGQDLALSLVELVPNKQLLRPLDWVMIVLYLGLIAGIGVYCYRRERKQSTAEFFVGSRTIPFWAAGISLYATNSSSIG